MVDGYCEIYTLRLPPIKKDKIWQLDWQQFIIDFYPLGCE